MLHLSDVTYTDPAVSGTGEPWDRRAVTTAFKAATVIVDRPSSARLDIRAEGDEGDEKGEDSERPTGGKQSRAFQ